MGVQVKLNSMRPLDINSLMLTSEHGTVRQKIEGDYPLSALRKDSSEGTTRRKNWKVNLPQLNCIIKDKH